MKNKVKEVGSTGQEEKYDDENADFWNEICGSQLAQSLGVTDNSKQSLKRFDDWYFDFYPYLRKYIPFTNLAGRKVLEVGLGYGTVSQRLAENGADYYGLDISGGPIHMVRHRLRQCEFPGEARQGSILDCPFPDEAFDYVVAIGCYHHTGNLPLAIEETRRVLKSGGGATIMLYNAHSYRRWVKWPGSTAKYFLWDKFGYKTPPGVTAIERADYDVDLSGNPAPETVFVSAGHLRRLASKWSQCTIHRENIGTEAFLARFERRTLVRVLGPLLGLDLYCRLVK